MDNVTALDKIVRSLSFEVQAVPQDNLIQVTTTSKSAPLNVKIRVRKKDEAGLHNGVITLPASTSHSSPEKIRLVSSDQTILSFKMIMEADFGKPKKKARKNILGIFRPSCLGSKTDEEDDNEGEINEESTTKSDGALKRSTPKNKRDERTRDFFGKCKPGGCLDPPFGEDREPYSPTNADERASDEKVLNAPRQSVENKPRSSSIFSNKIVNWKKKKINDDEAFEKEDVQMEKANKPEPVLDLYQAGSLQTSGTYSNSIMTYPHAVNSSEHGIQENKVRVSEIYLDLSKNSFNENSGPFFVPVINPKKIKLVEEETGSEKKPDNHIDKTVSQIPRDVDNITAKTETQPLLKDSITDIKSPESDMTISVEPIKDATKTKTEDVKTVPTTKIPELMETTIISTEDKEQIKETNVPVTSFTDKNLSPDISERLEPTKFICEQKSVESNTDILPFNAEIKTDDSYNNKIEKNNQKNDTQFLEAHKTVEREQFSNDDIQHILAPRNHDISQNIDPEATRTDVDNDLEKKNKDAISKIPEGVDTEITSEIFQRPDITAPRNIIGSDKKRDNVEQNSLDDKHDFGIDSNSEPAKAIELETKRKPEEVLDSDFNTTRNEEDILLPYTPRNELDHKSLNEDFIKSESRENTDKKPKQRSIGTLGTDHELSNYDILDTDTPIAVNDESGIPTPITRDTPIELELDDLQQLWKNDAESLESEPVNVNKAHHREENISILDEVIEIADETSNTFVPKNQGNNISGDNSTECIFDGYEENIQNTIPDREYKETIKPFDDFNKIEGAYYPNKDNLEITELDKNNIDELSMPVNSSDDKPMTHLQPLETNIIEDEDMTNVVPVYENAFSEDNFEWSSNEPSNYGDETLNDHLKDSNKTDEKHIKFIDDIDTEQHKYEDTINISPIEEDHLDDSKRNFLEFDPSFDLENKGNYSETKSLSPTRTPEAKIDVEAIAAKENLEAVLAGLDTHNMYPFRSVSGSQSPNTASSKPFKIDIAIQSYYDDNNKVVVKSFDSDAAPKRYPNDIVKVVKCDLKIGNEILIPIGSKNDLVVEIKSNKQPPNVENLGIMDTGMTEKTSLGSDFKINPAKRNLVIADDIRKTLIAVYEGELLPLRKSISELKSNMEAISNYQNSLRGRNMFMKKPRPSKVQPLFKKCGCTRR